MNLKLIENKISRFVILRKKNSEIEFFFKFVIRLLPENRESQVVEAVDKIPRKKSIFKIFKYNQSQFKMFHSEAENSKNINQNYFR